VRVVQVERVQTHQLMVKRDHLLLLGSLGWDQACLLTALALVLPARLILLLVGASRVAIDIVNS